MSAEFAVQRRASAVGRYSTTLTSGRAEGRRAGRPPGRTYRRALAAAGPRRRRRPERARRAPDVAATAAAWSQLASVVAVSQCRRGVVERAALAEAGGPPSRSRPRRVGDDEPAVRATRRSSRTGRPANTTPNTVTTQREPDARRPSARRRGARATTTAADASSAPDEQGVAAAPLGSLRRRGTASHQTNGSGDAARSPRRCAVAGRDQPRTDPDRGERRRDSRPGTKPEPARTERRTRSAEQRRATPRHPATLGEPRSQAPHRHDDRDDGDAPTTASLRRRRSR